MSNPFDPEIRQVLYALVSNTILKAQADLGAEMSSLNLARELRDTNAEVHGRERADILTVIINSASTLKTWLGLGGTLWTVNPPLMLGGEYPWRALRQLVDQETILLMRENMELAEAHRKHDFPKIVCLTMQMGNRKHDLRMYKTLLNFSDACTAFGYM